MGIQTVEMPGEHGRGSFRVRLEPGEDSGALLQDMKDIPVILRKEDKVLFCGYPETIRIFSEGGYREAELTVLTGTARLNRGKRDRVFQSSKLSYGDILGGVLGDTPDAAYIMTGQDRKTGTPFFQYRETDWEFLTRVCSRLRLPLVADSGLPGVRTKSWT